MPKPTPKPEPEALPRQSRPAPAPERGRLVPRVALHALMGVVAAVGCVTVFLYMRDYVERSVAPATHPPTVKFTTRPAWMSPLVADQLATSFRPAKAGSVFDHDMLVDVANRLRANPWVAKIARVRRVFGNRPGDTIEVDCTFRSPMALVRSRDDYWFVDANGIKLPERFAEADVNKIVRGGDGRVNIRVIEGVRQPPPADAGRLWLGEDLAASLDLVKRLYDQPFADDIVRVNCANFAGRVDQREAQLVLVTGHNTEIRWGRPWVASDTFIEVRPERKMDNLRRIAAKYGRVDAGQRWIDVRFERVSTPTPGGEPAAHADGGR